MALGDLLTELTEWVAARTGLVMGADLFAGEFQPFDRDQGDTEALACVMETGGIPSQPTLRGNVGEYNFQVLAVSKVSYFAARDMAWRIHRVMSDMPGIPLEHWTVCVCDAVSPPQTLGFDERTGREFSTNYVVRAYNKAAWAAV